jgi:LmbE family N-acetylglucosaminyl deacetylase
MGLAAPPGSISPRRKPVSQESMLVVSAQTADFACRVGGAAALAVSRGDRVKVLGLTYGEGGGSARAWLVFPQVTDRLS